MFSRVCRRGAKRARRLMSFGMRRSQVGGCSKLSHGSYNIKIRCSAEGVNVKILVDDYRMRRSQMGGCSKHSESSWNIKSTLIAKSGCSFIISILECVASR